MEFPRSLYKSPGPHLAHGGTFQVLDVADSDKLKAAIADGWSESIPEAISGKKSARSEILAEAEKLGIKVDGRWSDQRLADEIKKHVD